MGYFLPTDSLSGFSPLNRSRRQFLAIAGLGALISITTPHSCAMAEAPKELQGKRIDLVPKDGSWVEYSWQVDKDDGREKSHGSMTIKWIGTVLVDNKTCRWVESTLVSEDATKPRRVVLKFLFREESIRATLSGNAAELAPQDRLPITMWIKVDDDLPLSLAKSGWPNADPQFSRLVHDVQSELPPTPLRDEVQDSQEKLEARIVAFQSGTAECEGFRTRSVRTFNSGKAELQTSRSVWVFDEVPLGFAECEIRRKRLVDGEIDRTQHVTVSLRDFGANATTDLPDHN